MKIKLFLIILVLTIITACQNNNGTKMPFILKNENLEIHFDLPLEQYNFSRFDWTGKIVSLKYKGILVSGIEKPNSNQENKVGRGYYNEFGIEKPVAFDEAKDGEFFHKIGIGLLKKEGTHYDFSKEYEIKPADFHITTKSNKIIVECKSQNVNGFSYILRKEVELMADGFIISYQLHNNGKKTIETDEYCHNFVAINDELIGSDYILRFPFYLEMDKFNAIVNPDSVVEFTQNEVRFNNSPGSQFFFSNLSAGKNVAAHWELLNTKTKIGISETGSFSTNKVNLWGWKHVISPELFFEINIDPGQTIEWSRTYHVFELE